MPFPNFGIKKRIVLSSQIVQSAKVCWGFGERHCAILWKHRNNIGIVFSISSQARSMRQKSDSTLPIPEGKAMLNKRMHSSPWCVCLKVQGKSINASTKADALKEAKFNTTEIVTSAWCRKNRAAYYREVIHGDD